MSLRQAIEDQTREVEQRTSSLDGAKRALDALERTQAVLTNLTQQLRSVARQIIEHRHDQTHCPLCGTQFDPSDLDARLRESIRSLEDAESQRMRVQTQDLELAYQRDLTVLQALRALNRYQEGANNRTTVGSILVQVAADRDELVRLQVEFDALRQRVQEHERRGWTLDRLREIARSVALAPTDLNRDSAEAVTVSLDGYLLDSGDHHILWSQKSSFLDPPTRDL